MKALLIAAICNDYLKKLGETKALSKYSPKAVDLVLQAKSIYRDTNDVVFNIRESDIIECAKARGLQVGTIAGDVRVGVSADNFKALTKSGAVFSESFVCVHGFQRYIFSVRHDLKEPVQTPVCKYCGEETQHPTTEEIEVSKSYLRCRGSAPANKGSLILAARDLGYQVSCSLQGHAQIYKHTEIVGDTKRGGLK